MIEIAVNNLAAATGARTVTGEADRVCRGCVIDSRQVEEGTIFVAFPGENVDGNDFASRAVQSGADLEVVTGLCLAVTHGILLHSHESSVIVRFGIGIPVDRKSTRLNSSHSTSSRMPSSA